MAARKPEMLDVLEVECRDLLGCRGTLEGLYSTCGSAEIAMEHLLRPHNPTGIDFRSVVTQIQNFKDVLDGQMHGARFLFFKVKQRSEKLQELVEAGDPSMVDKVDQLGDSLLRDCVKLRDLIKRTANTCRGFHVACKIILEYVIEFYCTPME
ncbi:unnamed protein product [Larinioides sclopetarius]|uniref:Uncharacterized protein n=1 Tax=Larinioides sclopetarius TaxID=280406 RepID=A0AAV2BLQ0_9ARAC